MDNVAPALKLHRMTSVPKPPAEAVGGMFYFGRMLDKIRKHARGELRPDFHANLGRGADGLCTKYLRVDYDALKERVLAGGTDEEILEWCFENGRRLNETDVMVWNQFIAKLGWNDFASGRLAQLKAEHGLAHRDDIQTMGQFFDVDEGRAS